MRREFPAKVRKAVFARASGKCEKCSAVLKTGEGEIDHILPDALGGKPELANAMLLCRICHVAKSGDDVRRVRKADRQKAIYVGSKKPAGKLRSRGFPPVAKAPKPSSKQALPPRQIYAAVQRRQMEE
jgi:5-methylcytosine-specific restriction enzyme A